jgi:hypothetical protein
MPVAKKNTTNKTSKKKQPRKPFPRSISAADDTLFPEKLARANELLSKAKLLPH